MQSLETRKMYPSRAQTETPLYPKNLRISDLKFWFSKDSPHRGLGALAMQLPLRRYSAFLLNTGASDCSVILLPAFCNARYRIRALRSRSITTRTQSAPRGTVVFDKLPNM